MRIAIIGCGNMGLAFAKAFIQYDLVKKTDLLLIEKDETRSQALNNAKESWQIGTLDTQIRSYDLIIISVKPQDFLTLGQTLTNILHPDQVVMSIMAGIPIERIQREIGITNVVRAMPNTPAILGMGITGYTASQNISFSRLIKIENLINATGRAVYLEDESMLDAVTALSGSGPAYFYYYVKAMVGAGKKMGFDDATSLLFVKQTMLGAYHLLNNADKDLDQLISDVTSKGGTTQAALNVFEKHALDDIIQRGISAAQERAKQLSKS